MAHDREVAGIRGTEVLAHLSDYLDGDLAEAETQQVEAHLRGCDWCERFGNQMSAVVHNLREELGAAEPVADDVAERLLDRLAQE